MTDAIREVETDRVAVYPSRALRPVPGFTFAVPRGWVLEESPDALAAVHTPEAVDGFWVNALISSDRVARSVDLPHAAAATLARLQQRCPEATVTMEKFARFGERATYLRGVELTAPGSDRRLAQLQAMFFAPVEGPGTTVDLFQIIGTCLQPQLERFGADMVGIVASFRFT